MKPFHSAAPMAFIAAAAATTSVGLARGFNLANRLAHRSISLGLGAPARGNSNNDCARRASSLQLHRAASTACFIGSDRDGSAGGGGGSSSSTSALSSAPPAKTSAISSSSADTAAADDDDSEEGAIERMARLSASITGSLPPPKNFGGVTYLDTSSLAAENSHRVLFVLGGPGAGKGTQSSRIVDTYKCVHLSVGDLLRTGAEREDYPHADLVKDCLVKGNIVPVELSLGLLRIAMDEKASEGNGSGDEGGGYGQRIFLVDGFPRNDDNVRGWMEHMPSYTSVLGALVYNCPIEVLEERIMTRAETSGRSDDNLESARRRFETFRGQTEPVVRALERAEEMQAEENGGSGALSVVNIDAAGTVEEVWEETESAMDAYVRNDVVTANANLLKAIEGGDIEKFRELCDGELEVDPVYEGPNECAVSNAQVDIQGGIRAVVSYDRKVKGDLTVRETREWEHRSKGWICVRVSRKDLS